MSILFVVSFFVTQGDVQRFSAYPAMFTLNMTTKNAQFDKIISYKAI